MSRTRMTVGLLGPALVAAILAAIAGFGAVQFDGFLGTVLALAFAGFFAAVAVRDVRRWRAEMLRRVS